MALKYTPEELALLKKGAQISPPADDNYTYDTYVRPHSVDNIVSKIYEDLEENDTSDVQTLVLQGTTIASTSQAIYGVNLIATSTITDLATRLPDPVSGRQVVFINNSTMPILVFPSVVGGEINGVVNGSASIPNDGSAYVFYCTANPLPGAWTWTPPATGQIQVLRISVSHTNGPSNTNAYGVGNPGAQLINPPGPNWWNDININGITTLTFTPGQDYWATANFNPEKTLVTTKVYSNFIAADSPAPNQVPAVGRYVAYGNGAGMNNYTASGVHLFGGLFVPSGPLNVPVEIGDVGTLYKIQPANLVQVPPPPTDSIGIGPFTNYYYTFIITIPATAVTKVYDFDIFLEHT